jgi:hypothetical protein
MSDESNDTVPKQIVYDHEMAALAAVRDYRRKKLGPNPVPDFIQQELAERALSYREVLRKYRKNGSLDPAWEERDIHWIEGEQNRTVPVEVPSSRRNSNSRTEYKPAILTVDPERIVGVIRELEDISDELGFTANTKQRTPEDEATPEDLAGILHQRGQHNAAKQLPERFKNGYDPDEEAGDFEGDEVEG